MGWIAVGMGRLTAPSKSSTTEDTGHGGSLVVRDLRCWSWTGYSLIFFFFFALSFSVFLSVLCGCFLLALLIELGDRIGQPGRLHRPARAGRLLVHCAEPWSPAISAMVRPVSADSSY